MVRGSVLVLAFACVPGCSWILDFSDSAGVHDASIDGPYTAEECAYNEPNNTVDTAALVTVADMGPGAICKVDGDGGIVEDDDFYRFTVPSGTTSVTISVMFTQRPGGDLDLRLSDTTGAKIAESTGFTDTEMIKCPAVSPPCPMLAAGDYVFEVFPGMMGNLNNYTFTLALQ